MRRVKIPLTDDDFRELWIYAEYKRIYGPSAVNIILKQAAFSEMRAHRVPDDRRVELLKEYEKTHQRETDVLPRANTKEADDA